MTRAAAIALVKDLDAIARIEAATRHREDARVNGQDFARLRRYIPDLKL
ncbi:MAG: hypothetical protein H6899_03085 [Rhodobacter sp.]|nr:hypothetical protein [Paracoccaceae bacterium]MCC0078944.1 hypothetical protein [Rhodobacter sp.]